MYDNVTLHSILLLYFFFFQAEDGIRDLVRSRGLGDVYKRQPQFRGGAARTGYSSDPGPGGNLDLRWSFTTDEVAVSYTHLTLPTSDLV